MVATVYLVRHAEAMGNIGGYFQGTTDCDVSPKGKKQLEALKERFKDIEFDAIYSSPLKRTIETAEAVNFYKNYEIKLDKGLIEINGGILEGKQWSEFPVTYKKEFDLWNNHPEKFVAQGGESMQEVYDRITLTITKLAARNKGKTIVIVSHGCALKNFLCYAKGLPLTEFKNLGWLDNTSVTRVEFDTNLKPQIIFENDISHLSDKVEIGEKPWMVTSSN